MALRRAYQLAPRLWQQGQSLAPACNALAHGAFGDDSAWSGAVCHRACTPLLWRAAAAQLP